MNRLSAGLLVIVASACTDITIVTPESQPATPAQSVIEQVCGGAIQGNTIYYTRRGYSVSLSKTPDLITMTVTKTPGTIYTTEFYRILPDGFCGVSDR